MSRARGALRVWTLFGMLFSIISDLERGLAQKTVEAYAGDLKKGSRTRHEIKG